MATRQARQAAALSKRGAAPVSTAPEPRAQAATSAPTRAATQKSTRARPGQLMSLQEHLPVVSQKNRRSETARTSAARELNDNDNITVTPRKSGTPIRASVGRAQAGLSVEDSEDDEDSAQSQDDLEHSQPGDDDDDDEIALNAEAIATKLESLDKTAGELIAKMMPAPNADIGRTQKALLSDDDCKQCHDDFVEDREAFSSENYIDLSLVLRTLYSDKPDLRLTQGSWRPDAIVYKANLAQLMYDMLLHSTNRPSEAVLESAERNFAMDIAGRSPQGLAFSLELNTQLVIARMSSATGAWSEQTIAQDSFITPDSGIFHRWEALGLADERASQQAKHKKLIDDRLQSLKAASASNRDATVKKLSKQYTWSAFKDELVAYCEQRSAELDVQIAVAGQAHSIMAAVQNEIGLPRGPVNNASTANNAATASIGTGNGAEATVQAEKALPARATASQLKPSKSGIAFMKRLANRADSEASRPSSARSNKVLSTVAANARSARPADTNTQPPSSTKKRRREEQSAQSPDKRSRAESSTPLSEIDPTQDKGYQDGYQTQNVNTDVAASRRQARASSSALFVQPQEEDSSAIDGSASAQGDEPEHDGLSARSEPNQADIGEDVGRIGQDKDSLESKMRKKKIKEAKSAKRSARTHGVHYEGVDHKGNVIYVQGPWTSQEEVTLARYITTLGETETISFTGEATGLFHRKESTIRPKARGMKVNLIIAQGNTKSLTPGWKQVRLHKEGKDKLRGKRIDYDTDEEEPEGKGLNRRRPETRR